MPAAIATRGKFALRLRKLIGAVVLIVLVIGWSLLAMAVAQFPVIRDNDNASMAYYVIAGLGWVLPAMPLVRWMSRSRGRIRNHGDQASNERC